MKICVDWHPWADKFTFKNRIYIVCGRCQKAKVRYEDLG